MKPRNRILPVVLAGLAALLLAPVAARAEEWKNVSLIDGHCAGKASVKADPDSHTRDCLLMCAKGGYGIWTAGGEHLKFDAEGSKKAEALLEASTKADHVRVDVVGEREGDVLRVTSISMSS
jgi:hypothetical protein